VPCCCSPCFPARQAGSAVQGARVLKQDVSAQASSLAQAIGNGQAAAFAQAIAQSNGGTAKAAGTAIAQAAGDGNTSAIANALAQASSKGEPARKPCTGSQTVAAACQKVASCPDPSLIDVSSCVAAYMLLQRAPDTFTWTDKQAVVLNSLSV
jgi:hypothetical protein